MINKNTLMGILVIGAILVGYSVYNGYQMQEMAAQKRMADSAAYVRAANEAAVQSKIAAQIAAITIGDTASAEYYAIENDLLAIKVSTKGARIVGAEVKNYSAYNGDKLEMQNGDADEFSLNFYTTNSRNFETKNLAFEMTASEAANDTARLALRRYFGENSYVEYVYTLPKDSYMVDLAVNSVGLDNVSNVDIAWSADARRQEKAFGNENNYTTIAYRYPNDDGVEEMSIGKGSESQSVKTRVQWVAFKQQFFSSILISRGEGFAGAELGYSTYGEYDPGALIKHYSARLQCPYAAGRDNSVNLAFYFGPNKYNILRQYSQRMEALVPLGGWVIGWVNRLLVIPIFDVLEDHIASYGLIILILTVIIKLLLFPLTFKSYISSAKMRVLKPDVDKIAKKYPAKKDAIKKQQEVMALYKKTGVNPMGGCLPILVQFPILIAMFRFFPASIELRQKSFLWADDLSAYDSILNLPFAIPFYGDHVSLFTLLMAGALFVSSRMNMAQTPQTGMPGMKFMTLYLMPAMLLVWFNSYSAGLSYYYFLSNIITICQNLITRRMVDEKKLHLRLRENSRKPVKKSRFQSKLEEMAKASQHRQLNHKKQR